MSSCISRRWITDAALLSCTGAKRNNMPRLQAKKMPSRACNNIMQLSASATVGLAANTITVTVQMRAIAGFTAAHRCCARGTCGIAVGKGTIIPTSGRREAGRYKTPRLSRHRRAGWRSNTTAVAVVVTRFSIVVAALGIESTGVGQCMASSCKKQKQNHYRGLPAVRPVHVQGDSAELRCWGSV